MLKKSEFEKMGFTAYKREIKNPEDDHYFVEFLEELKHTANLTPEDDWNQGWLRGFYAAKAEKERNARD